jgi:hypothetical protein
LKGIWHYDGWWQWGFESVLDDLAALLPTSKATWLLIATGVATLAFALSAFACDRSGHKIIGPFLAAGAWLFGAFGILVWYWR